MNTSIIGSLAEKRIRSTDMYTPDAGEAKMLNSIVTKENMTLSLFVNNVTPASGDTAGTYTAAVGGGYAAITLTGDTGSGHWTVSTVANNAVAAYAEQTFTFTGGLTGATGAATSGVVTNGSTTVTVTSTTGMVAGNRISCATCVPAGTYVTSVTNNTTFEMSNAGSAGGTGLTIVYQNQIWGAALVGAGGTLYRVIKASSGWYPEANGDNYKVTPQITLKESTT